MFDSLVAFTKRLFNDDQPEAQPQAIRGEGLQRPLIFDDWGFSDNFVMIQPDGNLWNKDDLRFVMSEKKLRECYDERFRKALQKYGGGVQYRPPNIEAIRQYMIDMRDLYLIIISQKKNAQNLKEELDKLSAEFYRDFFPFLTRYTDNPLETALILRDLFNMLPMSFRTRDDSRLNDMMYKLYTHEKIVVFKMTENRLQDSHSFKRTCSKIDVLHADASNYLGRVSALRSIVLTAKSSAEVMQKQIIKKYNRKMKVQKILHILDKIKSKYQKVIDYCSRDLADTSMFAYSSLYRIFLIALLNFKSDSQKYTSLKLLKKFEDAVTKKLISIKKRIKNETYNELKILVANPRARRTEKLGMLVDLHQKISETSKEVLDKSRVEGKLPRGIEMFEDSDLLKRHFADIIAYNSSLDNERSKELLFGSGSSGGAGDSRPYDSKYFGRSMTKPSGDRDPRF